MIYKLAIFDHDRGAVFLPRAVPRKVTLETDADVRIESAGAISSTHEQLDITFPVNEGSSKASGNFVTNDTSTQCQAQPGAGEDLHPNEMQDRNSDEEAEGSDEGASSHEFVEEIGNSGSSDRICENTIDWSAFSHTGRVDGTPLGEFLKAHGEARFWERADHSRRGAEGRLAGVCDNRLCGGGPADEGDEEEVRRFTICQCCRHHSKRRKDPKKIDPHKCSASTGNETCYCYCHVTNACCDDENDQDGEEEIEDELAKVWFAVPDCDCEPGHHCCERGITSDDWDKQEQWLLEHQDEDQEYQSDSEIEDDEEHLDTNDSQGMQYNLTDSGVLLASTEIRQQCLPVYYGNNTFSWRFSGFDYERTFERFRNWAESTQSEHGQLIKGISFEGRSNIEEGVEFEADIDILDEFSYFIVQVAHDHLYESYLDAIRDDLEQKLTWVLFKVSSRQLGLTLSPNLIVRLGGTFVDAMQT